jgi:hypothetical protein
MALFSKVLNTAKDTVSRLIDSPLKQGSDGLAEAINNMPKKEQDEFLAFLGKIKSK